MKSSGVGWEFSNKAISIQKKWQVFKTLFRNIFYRLLPKTLPAHLEGSTASRIHDTKETLQYLLHHDMDPRSLLQRLPGGKHDTHEQILGAEPPGLVNSLLHHRVLNSLSLLEENWRKLTYSPTTVCLKSQTSLFVCFFPKTRKIPPCYRNFLNYNHFLWMATKPVSRLYRMEIARIATSKMWCRYLWQD